MINLSIPAVRSLMLAAQGLLNSNGTPKTKSDVLAIIRKMGVLQIDTISVVARSPYLVLWSRLGDYQPDWLDALLREGNLFEYWSHAACFIPIEDYPFYRKIMLERVRGYSNPDNWFKSNPEFVEKIYRYIETNGEVKSADFERTSGEAKGWWDWKEEKIALEVLHSRGEIMIARREKFQRVYDLRERVYPTWDDANVPAIEDVRIELTLKSIQALGVAHPKWIADYFRQPKAEVAKAVKGLLNDGRLIEVMVDGWEEVFVAPQENLDLIQKAADGGLNPTKTTLLSPFDPLVWDRSRARETFDFDYTIECYTPPAKRKYGYFTLPILHKGSLVGRLDPKAHRKEKVLEVKALFLEPDIKETDDLIMGLRDALKSFAVWHQTPEIKLGEFENSAFKDALFEALIK